VNKQIDGIAVLIPAFNAASTLNALLVRVTRFVPPDNVLVVSDGSTDGTIITAERHGVRVISLEKNQGKGAALRKGFGILQNDPQVTDIVTLDADLQHRPEDIPRFVQKKQQGGADIVIGMRNRTGTRMPIHRVLSNAITSYLVSLRTRTNMLDSQCGFRLIGKKVLSNVTIESFGFEAETEFLIKAIKQGFKVEFVPIETIYNGEKSHMTNWKTTLNFIKVLIRDY
jgi:glycosyltransferase involved in cell wall biosynthesis